MKKLAGISAVAILTLAGCGAGGPVEYAGESAADAKGNVGKVTFTKEGDDITKIQFDVTQEDGTSKRELSESGEYGMKEATGKSWLEHVESVESYVIENDKMPSLDADGKDVDGATGATITLTSLDEAFNNAKEVK